MRGFDRIQTKTVREELAKAYARMIYHTLFRRGITNLSRCAGIGMAERRRLLDSERRPEPFGVREEKLKLAGECVYCGEEATSVDHLTARQVFLAGGVISVQALNEFAAVLRRKFRLEWEVIADALADVRTALGPVRPIDVEIHLHAVALARSHGFSFYDALIVASALDAGCDTLLTEDLQAGRRVDGLSIVNPFV